MSSSPWPATAGAAPAPPTGAAAAAAAATPASATTSEQHPVKEGGDAAAAAVVQEQEQEEEEAKPQLPRHDDSEVEIQEHEQKINTYQAILAARLKAKYFSNKAFDGGYADVEQNIPSNHNLDQIPKYLKPSGTRTPYEEAHNLCTMLGNIFEAETIVDGETIQSSRWPCTSSFANSVKHFQDKSSDERSDSPSLAADSSAKNTSPSVAAEALPKNNPSALATENNLTPGKRQPSKKT